VYHALESGTRDYALKCGFRKVMIGLGGGIDSVDFLVEVFIHRICRVLPDPKMGGALT
jgi:hypothetical protein